jgi:hypothetical protein
MEPQGTAASWDRNAYDPAPQRPTATRKYTADTYAAQGQKGRTDAMPPNAARWKRDPNFEHNPGTPPPFL